MLIIASIATALLSALISYRNAVSAAEDFLKSQALGIAVSVDSAISRYGTEENILPDIIGSGKWEGIAFIALYARDGQTVLHSNKNLINKKNDDRDIGKTAESGEPTFGYRELGTGEEVYVLNFPVHLQASSMALRIALHPYPARAIVRGARFQLLSILVALLVLSLITVFFLIATKRREELERVLAEKEKLSVLGEMAAVLAHEIRNPLGSIKGFAQYLKEQIAGQKPRDMALTEQYLGVIVSESKRIETLTEELLAYAKQDDLKIERFSLSGLIRETLSLLPSSPLVSFTVAVPDDLILFSDRSKLRQVVANLVQNGLEAIPGEGTIGVSAEEREEYVHLKIADSGLGMDENVMGKIFKPFYTTKAKGTGLGLAIVERHVKTIGGKIKVESEKGKGSAFSLELPKQPGKSG